MMHIVEPDQGAPGTLRILAGVEQTRGLYFAFESETPPSATNDVHAHAAYDESEYVLTGRREIVVEDQRWEAESGFFALAPRHARHGMRTIGSSPSRWLHFFSPAQIERYFVERERMRAAGASTEALRALSGRYGVGASGERTAEGIYASASRNGVIVMGRDTRDAYALAEMNELTVDEHVHVDQEEAFYVLAGELTLELDGTSQTLAERAFGLVPRGVRRRHVASPGSRVLSIYSPGHALPH